MVDDAEVPARRRPSRLASVPAPIPLPGDAGTRLPVGNGASRPTVRLVRGGRVAALPNVNAPVPPYVRLPCAQLVDEGIAAFASADSPNVLIEGDALEALGHIPTASVDLIFVDPPYNLQLRATDLRRPNDTAVAGVTDAWDAFGSFAAYDAFTRRWVHECRRVLKPTGSLWVIGSYHCIFRVGTVLQDVGFWLLNDVVWVKANPMPHFRGVRFTNAHETLIWAKREESARNITFNYREMKAFNGGKQMRSDWYMPICGGRERLRDEAGQKVHSTQKPEALLERVVRATSRPGDVVLDPFAGSGTTGAVAQRLGRRWIMIEREAAYCSVIADRVATVAPRPPVEVADHADGNDAAAGDAIVPSRRVARTSSRGLRPAGLAADRGAAESDTVQNGVKRTG